MVVLASGEGSNFEALVNKARGYQILGLISDKPKSGAVAKAIRLGIPYSILENNLPELLGEAQPDLVVLAGFMKILKPEVVDNFKCINVHPSLLPKYPGLNTHKRALEAGDTEHGCTVHLVDHGVDTGPRIAQAKLAITEGEAENSLQNKVKHLEHKLFPWVLNKIAAGDIYFEGKISDSKVCYSRGLNEEANSLGFILL